MASPVNWLFLAELVVVVIVTSAFLFYWNRLFGALIAFLIRLAFMRKTNTYIFIGSFQISPLAGRISFRDVEYHSSNMSFRALHGNITFRYWKFRVRQEGETGSSNTKKSRLPCRISVTAEGVEMFLYNRTPAYDAIVERMKKHEQQEAEADGASQSFTDSAHTTQTESSSRVNVRQRKPQKPTSPRDSEEQDKLFTPGEDHVEGDGHTSRRMQSRNSGIEIVETSGVSWLHEILPVELHIQQGSIVLGSDATPMVFIADFKRANGVVEVTDSRNPLDLHKISTHLSMSEVHILMRTNVDYTGPLLSHGKRVYDEALKDEPDVAQEPPSIISSFSGFHKLAKKFPSLFDPKLSAQTIAGIPPDRVWKGLARYRLPDEEDKAKKHQEDRQYAKVTQVLHTQQLDVTYFSDTPGKVPEVADPRFVDPNDEIGNVEVAPEYGIDVVLHGGLVNYGPWTDRQRDALQKAFNPSIFFDSTPRAKLKPGDDRVHSQLVINVNIDDRTTLRIPTREPSKDWLFQGAKTNAERRYGWLDVNVGPNSSVTYTQSQWPTAQGYESMVLLHLDTLEVASSVNLVNFVMAKSCKVSMTMPTPLVWNAQRNWGIDVTLDSPEIVLLREHITLISDLSKDWSSGGTGDFHHFVPMHYSFRLSLIKYHLHLYVNDFNIVDNPRSRDRNAFVNIDGPRLDTFVAVSTTRYRPEFSIVPFTINAHDADVGITLPVWDTHRSFGTGGDSIPVGKIGRIDVSGSYRYYSSVKPDHQETLKLHIDAERVVFTAMGWAVRRMFSVKDNYFGNFTQFATMQEYLERFDHSPDSVGDPVVQKYRPGRSDPFAVHMTLNIRDSLILMSDEIYSAKKGVAIPVPELQLDLKNNEYQMDMAMDAAPTYCVACDDLDAASAAAKAPLATTEDVVFVEGIAIKANRLFGPPPKGTTYVCMWDLAFDRVAAFLSPEFKETLAAVGSSVGYNFTDHDNAPTSIYLSTTPPDAIELPEGLFLDTSSMASKTCRGLTGMGIPSIKAFVVRKREHHRHWEPVGSLSTGLSIDIYRVPKGWQESAQAQQDFLREQDEPTRRIPYLYNAPDDHALGRHIHGVYAPCPRIKDVDWDEHQSDGNAGFKEDDYYDSSSQGTSDGTSTDTGSVIRTKLARRKRTLSVATSIRPGDRQIERSSFGDESDSVSSVSSASTSDALTPAVDLDMPTALETYLRNFHRIQRRAHRMFEDAPPPTSPDETHEPPTSLTITDGGIFRFTLSAVSVEINPDTVTALLSVGHGLGSVQARPAQLLDELLRSHVSKVQEDNSVRGSTLYDVNLPAVCARLLVGPFTRPETVVRSTLVGARCRITKTPVPDSSDSAVDVNVDLGSIQLTTTSHAVSPTLSLLDVPHLELKSDSKLLPFVHYSLEGLDVTYGQSPSSKLVQAKVKDFKIRGTPQGVAITSHMVDQWRHVLDEKPPKARLYTYADLIYDIMRGAEETGCAATLPSFMYETAYGLHVTDQRNIRLDLGWMTLQRFRHWMQSMAARGIRLPLREPRPTRPDMATSVVNELTRYDMMGGVSEDVVVNQPFMRKAFGEDLRAAAPLAIPRVNSRLGTFFLLQSVDIRNYGRLLQTGVIAPSVLLVDTASVGVEKQITWDDHVPSTDLRTTVSVSRVSLDIQNSFIPTCQAILTHIDTHRTEIRDNRVVKDLDHASAVAIDVQLAQVGAAVTAGGVRMDISLEQARGSVKTERSDLTSPNSKTGRHRLERVDSTVNCTLAQVTLREAASGTETADTSLDRAFVVGAIRGAHMRSGSLINSADENTAANNLVFGVESFDFDSRPQLKSFYAFGQEWKNTHYPMYEPLLAQAQAVIGRQGASESPKAPPLALEPETALAKPPLTVDLKVKQANIQVRAAKGLWLGWDLGNIYLYRQGTLDDLQYGLRVDPQTVGAYTTAKRQKNNQSSVIRLPSINSTGSYRKINKRPHLNAMVSLGMFTGVVKPTVLDRLLSLHQKLGNDLAEVIREYRGQRPVDSSPKPKKTDDYPLVFRIEAGIDGVRVGLRADDVPSTLMFEALQLKASASNVDTKSLQWFAKAEHVGLSVGRHVEDAMLHTTAPLRGPRSVSMTFDVKAEETPGTDKAPSKLTVKLSHVHTVMHVAALSEISGLVHSWMTDISVLNNVHSAEVAEVKEQTSKVLRTLEGGTGSAADNGSSDANEAAASAADSGLESWFAARLLEVQVHGFGMAIPLDEGASLDVRQLASGAGPALLFTIRVISLTTSKTDTARFKIQQSLLQFVDKFDSNLKEHYSGDFHTSSNRMALPNIESEAQLTTTPDSWSVMAHCSATDFNLSLTPEIADGIGRLTDLYERGKEHLSVLEQDYLSQLARNERSDSLAVKYEEAAQETVRPKQRGNVRMSFRFDSGLVELYCPPSGDAKPDPQRSGARAKYHQDTFTLPTVSVWVDYTGPSEKPNEQIGTLLVNLAVHESQNVLRPTILPFFVELVRRVEKRSKERVAGALPVDSPKPPESPLISFAERVLDQPVIPAPKASGKLRLRITLRIDRSELRLSCAPDSNAYLDLKWESGGFLVSTLIGGKDTTTFAGSVSGVTALLSHEFAEEGRGCVEAGAKDMAFSFALCNADKKQRGLSVVVDTQVSVKFRLDAYSAWLIFMAVWVDNAPDLEVLLSDASAAQPAAAPVPVTGPKLAMAAIVRFRSIDFDANVSVSQARLEMTPIVIRTVSNGEQTEVDLSIGITQITATGDMSGDIRSESLKFHTTRRSSRATDATNPAVLQMAIEGGDLHGNLFIGDMNIVRFQLEPSKVTLADDWREYARTPTGHVFLDFIVKAGKFHGVLRFPAIPRLLGHFYSIFELLESQNRIASHRSKVFKQQQKRSAQDRTPMTTVVLSTVPRAGANSTTPSHVKTAQTMRFELAGIDVGIFSDDYDDGTVADWYRFVIGNIAADLKRQESRGGMPQRELELFVSSVAWQSSDGRRATKAETHDISASKLIEASVKNGHRDVVVLPRMTLKMNSTEAKEPPVLDYDFDLVWGETDGDIKVLPNFFDAAIRSFRKLLAGIEEQQLNRDRRRGLAGVPKSRRKGGEEEERADKGPPLSYHRRGTGPWNNPVPKLRALGETTGDAAMLVPRIKAAVGELPSYSHRFVTLPLEDGMDLLLKLYERQLPQMHDDDPALKSPSPVQEVKPLPTETNASEDSAPASVPSNEPLKQPQDAHTAAVPDLAVTSSVVAPPKDDATKPAA
ncbi:Macrophage colony-stimulating factor 1 receptor [Vanrija albida]|uniref:Macrophage colony-stimulating factor 1 receptor n=1 Tax=Vanrija albida TaxID=181172 RepID=A0ABR3Q4Q0_9TREE